MLVGVCRLTLHVSYSHSLKEKRAVLRRVKDRAMAAAKIRLVEVGGQDTWQRIELGFAQVGIVRAHVEAALEQTVRFIEDESQATIVDDEREIIDYGGGGLYSGEPGDHVLTSVAVGAARPETGNAEAAWLPEAWRETVVQDERPGTNGPGETGDHTEAPQPTRREVKT